MESRLLRQPEISVFFHCLVLRAGWKQILPQHRRPSHMFWQRVKELFFFFFWCGKFEIPPSIQIKLHWDNFCKSEILIFQVEKSFSLRTVYSNPLHIYHYVLLMFSKAFLGKGSSISFGQEKEGFNLKRNHQPCGDTKEVIICGAWVTSEYQPDIKRTQFQKSHSVLALPFTCWMVLPGWLPTTPNLIFSCFLCARFLFGSESLLIALFSFWFSFCSSTLTSIFSCCF